MSDKRRRDHAALLTISGKKYQVELYAAEQWTGQETPTGLYRLSVNGVWHGGHRGSYTFLPMREALQAVLGLFEADGLMPPALPPEPPIPMGSKVRVHYGPEVDGTPAHVGTGYTKTPPYLAIDGIWYVWVWVGVQLEKVQCRDVTVLYTPAFLRRR